MLLSSSPDGRGVFCSGRCHLWQFHLFRLALQRCCHQSGEKWMRAGGSGTELRMRLRRDVVRMHFSWKLDVLDQSAVWRGTADRQPGPLQLVAVFVVHLEAVPVPFLDVRFAVDLADNGVVTELGRVKPEPHGAPHVSLASDDI